MSTHSQHEVLLFGAYLVSHGDVERVPSLRGRECESDSGVTCGGLNKRHAGLENTLFFCVPDHVDANAIFGGACDAGKLALNKYFAGEAVLLGNSVKPHHGGVADAVEDVVIDLSWRSHAYIIINIAINLLARARRPLSLRAATSLPRKICTGRRSRRNSIRLPGVRS